MIAPVDGEQGDEEQQGWTLLSLRSSPAATRTNEQEAEGAGGHLRIGSVKGDQIRDAPALPTGLGTSEHGWESRWKALVMLGDWDICSPFLLPTGHPNPTGSCAHSVLGEVAGSHEGTWHSRSHGAAQAALPHPFDQSRREGGGWLPEGDKRTERFWDNRASLRPPA